LWIPTTFIHKYTRAVKSQQQVAIGTKFQINAMELQNYFIYICKFKHILHPTDNVPDAICVQCSQYFVSHVCLLLLHYRYNS